MAVTVRIPGPLRRVTENRDKVELDAEDLAGLVTVLEQQFPGIQERLLDEKGEIRHFINFYVNGEDVQFLQGLQTAVKSGDEVSIVPAVAGGR